MDQVTSQPKDEDERISIACKDLELKYKESQDRATKAEHKAILQEQLAKEFEAKALAWEKRASEAEAKLKELQEIVSKRTSRPVSKEKQKKEVVDKSKQLSAPENMAPKNEVVEKHISEKEVIGQSTANQVSQDVYAMPVESPLSEEELKTLRKNTKIEILQFEKKKGLKEDIGGKLNCILILSGEESKILIHRCDLDEQYKEHYYSTLLDLKTEASQTTKTHPAEKQNDILQFLQYNEGFVLFSRDCHYYVGSSHTSTGPSQLQFRSKYHYSGSNEYLSYSRCAVKVAQSIFFVSNEVHNQIVNLDLSNIDSQPKLLYQPSTVNSMCECFPQRSLSGLCCLSQSGRLWILNGPSVTLSLKDGYCGTTVASAGEFIIVAIFNDQKKSQKILLLNNQLTDRKSVV